jgi:hypothetical protein
VIKATTICIETIALIATLGRASTLLMEGPPLAEFSAVGTVVYSDRPYCTGTSQAKEAMGGNKIAGM